MIGSKIATSEILFNTQTVSPVKLLAEVGVQIAHRGNILLHVASDTELINYLVL
jgi:hypothetical protein